MLDDAELEGAFNEKTKMIIINTPHNPMGKIFNRFANISIILAYFVVATCDTAYLFLNHSILELSEKN